MINKKTKRIIDPVFGAIQIDIEDFWVWDILKCREFQKMRSISQIGPVSFIFPGATHTRFFHLLGTFEVARKIISHFEPNLYSKLERKITLAAALLHDIGHGPWSHSFEYFVGCNHEEYGARIINNSNGEIYKALVKNKIPPNEVVNVIEHKPLKTWMTQIISSQLDADRLDYLIRDSYYTGTVYGLIDREYLLSNVKLVENKLVFLQKTLPTIENYLLNRYYTYLQVYHNKSSIAWETLVKNILVRIKDLYNEGYKFKKITPFIINFEPWFKNKQWNLQQYQELSDNYLCIILSLVEFEDDEVLKTLGKMFNTRQNFISVPWSVAKENEVKKMFADCKYKDYYFNIGRSLKKLIYDFDSKEQILILTPENKIVNINNVSSILKSLKNFKTELKLIIYKNNN